ncbi:helix-turn-helix domain-containing [Fusarium sporotrichioides]|uniref:Helix-turn-helix domain-containing n=1 Tax=Fusarium sporotrichioides TaxID=5514 RepID=A0A395SBD1_FUSSP|nr:helix-turn-helix domain-containing [Fusarium sporotrichioides]
MSYTLYDAAILHTKEALQSLSAILKKAASHPNASSFPEAKLAPDMLDLNFQVFFTTDTAQKIVARTTGTEPLNLSRDDCSNFEQYQARIAQVLEIIEKADKETVEKRAAEVVTIGLGPGKSADMKCRDYVQGYGIPNVFFHLTTAYAILRKEGVELGKQDYIGPFMGQYLQ